MKLKKIASLMLAGVMAISMLAGCSNGSNGNNDKEEINTDVLSAASVIAELDKNTTDKVTFSANTSLESALNKALTMTGSSVLGFDQNGMAIFADLVVKAGDMDVVSKFTFPHAEWDQDMDAETRICAYAIPAADLGEKAAVDRFAAMVDQKVVDLEENGQYYAVSTDQIKNDQTYTKYSYTGNVAVVKVEDVMTGYVGYVGVMTVTCTPAEATGKL